MPGDSKCSLLNLILQCRGPVSPTEAVPLSLRNPSEESKDGTGALECRQKVLLQWNRTLKGDLAEKLLQLHCIENDRYNDGPEKEKNVDVSKAVTESKDSTERSTRSDGQTSLLKRLHALKSSLMDVSTELQKHHRVDPGFPKPKNFIVSKLRTVQEGVIFFSSLPKVEAAFVKILRVKLFLILECYLSFERSRSFLGFWEESSSSSADVLPSSLPSNAAKESEEKLYLRTMDRVLHSCIITVSAAEMGELWYLAQKFNQYVLQKSGVAF